MIALITLRKGVAFGLQTIIGSLLVLLVFSVISDMPLELSLIYTLVILLPVWIVSTSLRLTELQGVLLLTAGLLAISLIITTYVVIGDVANWWQEWLGLMLEKTVSPEQATQYREVLGPAAQWVNAMMIAGLMLNIVMSVLCARWWQSKLFNPGAFRKEFYALRLPVFILPVSGIIAVLVFAITGPLQGMFRDILVLLLFMYLVQGISSVHRNVDKYKISSAWLVSMYILLIVLPQMGLFIACLGVTDVYLCWRKGKKGAGFES